MACLPWSSRGNMATAKPQPLPPRRRAMRPKVLRRRWRMPLVLGLLAVVALIAWCWTPIMGYAHAGAAYGARVTCSCRYLGGRSLEDCAKDFMPGMALISLSEDAKAKAITARFPLLARHTARLQPGAGCVLDRWED